MSDYKNNLTKLLKETVFELYSGDLIFNEITKNGVYCDFDLSEPINPEKISEINRVLSDKNIPCAYELSSFSGVYQDGDASKKMLQRVYVTAFATQEELKEHKDETLNAANRKVSP